MQIQDIKQIAVMGSGAMGSQIAMVCALAGYDVVLYDVSKENLARARENLMDIMEKRVKKGRVDQASVDQAFQRLTFSSSLEQAVEKADFIIEAVTENLDVKRELFQKLDKLAPSHAILATNSSTIVSSKLAEVVERKDKVCNMHFFNPALVMELVEVVKGPHTSEETANVTMELARTIGKTPILLKKEIFGFVVNRVLNALFDEAIYLYEQGVASVEEIDLAVEKGLNHPMGPFKLIDFTGVDVNYHLRELRYAETGDPKDAPQPSLKELYEKGHLGRKTGKGYYQYN